MRAFDYVMRNRAAFAALMSFPQIAFLVEKRLFQHGVFLRRADLPAPFLICLGALQETANFVAGEEGALIALYRAVGRGALHQPVGA